MSLELINLDDETRRFMLEELDLDLKNKTRYVGKRLREKQVDKYFELLRSAIKQYDDEWLETQIGKFNLLNETELRAGKPVKVPVTAAQTLAEGEFNRYYIRGLSLRAIDEGIDRLTIYRAKEVRRSRSDSEDLEGTDESPEVLLENARIIPGTEEAVGLPHGPNSGLSVKLPDSE